MLITRIDRQADKQILEISETNNTVELYQLSLFCHRFDRAKMRSRNTRTCFRPHFHEFTNARFSREAIRLAAIRFRIWVKTLERPFSRGLALVERC